MFGEYWLPTRLRHPVFSYLAAVIVEGIAVALTLPLEYILPGYSHYSLLVVLGVVLVALTWGAGPSLVATLVGALLLDWLIIPPPLAWSFASATDDVSLGLVLALVPKPFDFGHLPRARLMRP